jgi:hypothetical protein
MTDKLPIPLFADNQYSSTEFEGLPDVFSASAYSYQYDSHGRVSRIKKCHIPDKTPVELSRRLILIDQSPTNGDVSITFFDKWFKTHTLPVTAVAGVAASDLIFALAELPELRHTDGTSVFKRRPIGGEDSEADIEWRQYARRMQRFILAAMADSLRRARLRSCG